VRTGDATRSERIFDQNKVQREIDAQVAITAEFGKQASKAAGTYADQKAIAARRAGNEAEAKKWDEGGEYRNALHTGIGALTGGLGGAVGTALSASALPSIGESIAALNLPDGVRDALNAAIGTALGAVGGASGATAGLNQAGNNYISHSPFRQVRQTVSQENARLLNACGANCTQADFLNIDQQVAQVERAANLAAIAQVSSMTQHQAQELAQLMLELAPVYGTGESALQLITGQSSLTGEEASRFWAAIGVVPVAGGVLKKVGEPASEAISKIFKEIGNPAENLLGVAKEGGAVGKVEDVANGKVKWVDENAGMSQRARDYNDTATGTRSNPATQSGQAPALERTMPDGSTRTVKFDGVDGNVLVDRKISVVTTSKAKEQALRQSDALSQNGLTGRWEVPNQSQASRAQKMFDELGIKNISVKVVHEPGNQ